MKKMLIRSCLSVALALCAQAAMADYLYFFVGDDSGNAPKYNNEPVGYTYATVKMVDNIEGSESSYLSLYEGGATTSSGVAMMAGSTDPAYAKLPDNPSYNTFLVELWNNDGRVAWQSYSLDDVRLGGHIVSSSAQGTPLNVTTVVPEPTGGVLMLLGRAVLTIRRKTRMI